MAVTYIDTFVTVLRALTRPVMNDVTRDDYNSDNNLWARVLLRSVAHFEYNRDDWNEEPVLKLYTLVYTRDAVPQVVPCAAILEFSDCETRVGDHLCELWLAREFANRLDEILV